MAIPARYTEATLAQYMLSVLEPEVYTCFDWNTGSFTEEVIDTMLAYGAETVVSMTDIQRVRLLATYFAWRKAYRASSKFINNSVDRDFRSQSQIWEHIKEQYEEAKATADPHLGEYSGYAIQVGTMTWAYDPYTPYEVEA
jgi:hypothetical protein